MTFWLLSAVILLLSGVLLAWPLLQGDGGVKGLGPLLIVSLPVIGLVLYTGVGTPEAIDQPAQARAPAPVQQQVAEDHQMDDMVGRLEQRLQANPEDLAGWMLLGRTLKTIQRFEEAEAALRRATELAPDDPLVQVELAEAMLYNSDNPQIGDDVRSLLEGAVAVDPTLEKGLWLLGVAAVQQGDDRTALAHWEQLLPLMDENSGATASVREQIGAARARLGEPESTTAPVMAPATQAGISVAVSLGEESSGLNSSASILYVFAHPPGGVGMPLAVKRVGGPQFPLEVRITENDMLMPNVTLADFPELLISARLSQSGSANAASGDVNASAQAIENGTSDTVQLVLDQVVP